MGIEVAVHPSVGLHKCNGEIVVLLIYKRDGEAGDQVSLVNAH